MAEKLGASYYYKSGIKAARITFSSHKANIIKVYMFVFASLLSKLLFIASPLFALSKLNIEKQIAKTNDINLIKSFDGTNNIKTYWTLLVIGLIKFTITFSMVLLFASLAVGLFYLGYILSFSATLQMEIIIGVLLASPAALVALFIPLYAACHYSATTYVVSMNPEVQASDALFNANEGMKKGGVATLIFIWLRPFIYTIVLTAIIVLSSIFLLGTSTFNWVIGAILIALCVLIFLIFLPKYYLGCSTAIYLYYVDQVSYDNVKLVYTVEEKNNDETYSEVYSFVDPKVREVASRVNKKAKKTQNVDALFEEKEFPDGNVIKQAATLDELTGNDEVKKELMEKKSAKEEKNLAKQNKKIAEEKVETTQENPMDIITTDISSETKEEK